MIVSDTISLANFIEKHDYKHKYDRRDLEIECYFKIKAKSAISIVDKKNNIISAIFYNIVKLPKILDSDFIENCFWKYPNKDGNTIIIERIVGRARFLAKALKDLIKDHLIKYVVFNNRKYKLRVVEKKKIGKYIDYANKDHMPDAILSDYINKKAERSPFWEKYWSSPVGNFLGSIPSMFSKDVYRINKMKSELNRRRGIK